MSENTTTQHNRTESVSQVVLHRLDSIQGDVSQMHVAIRELAIAVTKLAVFEERLNQNSADLVRAFKEIEKCTGRHEMQHSAEASELKILQLKISALELLTPLTKQTNNWVTSGLVGAAILAAMFIANKVGLK